MKRHTKVVNGKRVLKRRMPLRTENFPTLVKEKEWEVILRGGALGKVTKVTRRAKLNKTTPKSTGTEWAWDE